MYHFFVFFSSDQEIISVKMSSQIWLRKSEAKLFRKLEMTIFQSQPTDGAKLHDRLPFLGFLILCFFFYLFWQLYSITIHHVSASFEREDFVLDAIPIQGHTGDEIASTIESSLQKNGLAINKLICIVRDDASNMKRTCNLLEINRWKISKNK